MATPPFSNRAPRKKFFGDSERCRRWEVQTTYPERDCQRIQHQDEEVLEEVGCIVRKASHPVRSAEHLASAWTDEVDEAAVTYMVETMIVGNNRSGTTSNRIRVASQAVGLSKRSIEPSCNNLSL